MQEPNINEISLKTLDDLLNYSTFFDIERFANVEEGGIISNTTFDIYYPFLKDKIISVKTKKTHTIFDFNPKLLSKMLYGTPNLDWLLVRINNQSPSRFIIRERLNIIRREDIVNVFNFLSSKLNT